MRQLPVSARLYLSGVVLLAALLAFGAANRLEPGMLTPVLVLSVLALAAESASQSLGPGFVTANLSISTTMPVMLASYLIVGPWGAAIVGVAALAECSLPLVKRVFNAAQLLFLASWPVGSMSCLAGTCR